MLALHLENLVFLFFIGFALLFQLLARAATKTTKRPGDTARKVTSAPPPLPRGHSETDQERIRKFLEALGQPAGSEPPPPIVHRTDIPPRPVAPVQPPASMRPLSIPRRAVKPEAERKRTVVVPEDAVGQPGEWLRKINYPGQIPQPPAERKVYIPKTAEPTTFEVHKEPTQVEATAAGKTPAEAYAMATRAVSSPAASESNIATLLRSTSGLRDAIILREIFGPPRSFQPLELI